MRAVYGTCRVPVVKYLEKKAMQMSCNMVWWYNSVLQGLTCFVTGFHDYILACVFDVCMVIICGWVLKYILYAYIVCMVLTLECGLRHFLLRNNVGYDSEVMALWLWDISWWYNSVLEGLTWFVVGFHDYMLACVFYVCMVMTYGLVLKLIYLGCMVLTLECVLRHLLLRNNVGYVSDDMTCCLWDNSCWCDVI